MAKKYTRAEWEALQKRLPPEDRESYENYLAGLEPVTQVGTSGVTVVAGPGIETASAYGITEALREMFPELEPIFELFKSGQTSKALEELYKTNYYKNFSAVVKGRFKLKAEQRPVWESELNKYIENQRRRLIQKGIRVDEATLVGTLTTAFENGFDDNMVDASIMKTGKVSQVGGDILGNVSALQAYARAYGVSELYNQQYWDQISKDLFEEKTTEEDIQLAIRNLSASAYPAFSAGILSGQSMEAQGSYITQTLTSVLERPVTLNSPEAKKFLQYINPKTGKPELVPQWLVETEAKKLPGWEYTDNAIASLDTLGLRALRDWGLA